MLTIRRSLLTLAALGVAAAAVWPVAATFAQRDDTAPPAAATSTTGGGLIDRLSPACSQYGNCDFCDVLDGFMILTRWILGISGSVALALFVWFGFQFIISNGNSSIVGAARKGMVGTVVGLAIVFGGWEIINLVLYAAITPTSSSSSAATSIADVILFQREGTGHPWYQYCADRPKPPANIPGVTGA